MVVGDQDRLVANGPLVGLYTLGIRIGHITFVRSLLHYWFDLLRLTCATYTAAPLLTLRAEKIEHKQL